MHKRIVFRSMDHSDSMEDYANQQLEKIEEFLANEPTPINIELILQPSKKRSHHHVELRVKTPNYDLVSNYEHEGVEFYDVLDRVVDVMYKRLREEKKKMLDKRKSAGRHEDFKAER